MKIRTLAAGAALAILAAACSSQGAKTSTSSSGGAAPAAQGVTDTSIKIGTTQPLTGGAATSGGGFKAGLEAATKEANDKGGVNGRRIDLTVLDDGFEAARSVANIRRLGDEEKAFAVLSPAGSANLPGSWPYVKQTGLIVFGPVLPPDPKIAPVYLLGTSHTNQARVIVDFLAQKGVKTVGVIGQDNDLGASILKGVQDQTAKQGMQVVDSEKTEPNSTDVSSAVLKLRDAKPDAVVFGTDNTQTALVMKQAKQLGWSPVFVGDSSTITTGSTGTVGPAGAAAEGAYGTLVTELTSSSSPDVAAYRQAMQASNPAAVDNAYALQAYATAKVFFGVVGKMGKDMSWANFAKVAESLRDFQVGVLPPVTFGPVPDGHTGTVGAKVAQFSGGTWKVVTPDWIQPK